MLSYIFIFALFSLSSVRASPVAKQQEPRAQWYPPYTRCQTCFLSSWTQGPECSTDKPLLSTISRIVNPPASATSTYTPTQWCSDYLRHTGWSTTYSTSSGVSTYTDWTITHILITTTDFDHPTSTMFCPIPSSGMECGWDSNTIAPWEQQQDWSVEKYYNSTECQQICLGKSACRAYRLQDGNSWCEIFNVGLGKGASNVINPTPNGSQWWDRNCGKHVPTSCKTTAPVKPTAVQTTNAPAAKRATPKSAAPSQALITSSPTPAPRKQPRNLAKRDAPLPPYLDDLNYYWSNIYVEPACSCLVSSVLPPVSSTTTSVVTKWTASTTVKETYEDVFTVTETVRETTVYTSVN